MHDLAGIAPQMLEITMRNGVIPISGDFRDCLIQIVRRDWKAIYSPRATGRGLRDACTRT
jgi:hypothetical protein